MIVGQGMLAQAFSELRGNPDVLIFASGVSNSQETDHSAFLRERDLLLNQIERSNAKFFVYFGSCGVNAQPAARSPYLSHKAEMEKIVISSPGGIVFRLPQVVGKTENPNTLTNYLRDRIVRGERFELWAEAERNLIDVDDVAAIAMKMLEDPSSLLGAPHAIASEVSMQMIEIVKIFEKILGLPAQYVALSKGNPLAINIDQAREAAQALGISLGEGYVQNVIQKYYGEVVS